MYFETIPRFVDKAKSQSTADCRLKLTEDSSADEANTNITQCKGNKQVYVSKYVVAIGNDEIHVFLLRTWCLALLACTIHDITRLITKFMFSITR